MKIALISDIHANMEALENVLRDIDKQGVEKIHFLGDAVGYGCNPDECVKKINQYCDIKILGNHDYALMGLESIESFNHAAKISMKWTQSRAKKKTVSIMTDFEMETDFLDFHLVHSSPKIPEQWNYILSPDQASAEFKEFSQTVCFIGHSHIPTVFKMTKENTVYQNEIIEIELEEDCRYIVNVGSVGQPRDNDPRACYMIANTETNTLAYRRVEYDVSKTQTKMREASLPEFLIERLAIGV